jgi:protoheme IX farnesyltransferase
MARIGDFLTLTKPGITLFIVMVAVAGFFTVSPYPPNLRSLAILAVVGALGSAGSAALNHFFDRDIDRKMHRTSDRPIPMDNLMPAQALLFGVGLIALSLIGAFFLLNTVVMLAIASGVAVYVGLYTLWLKRKTPWGTVLGGYAGSAAVLGGGAAVAGTLPLPVILLAVIVFLWTPPHFWSLAIALSSDFGRADLPALPDRRGLKDSARTVAVSAALLLPPTVAFALLGATYFPFLLIGTVAGVGFFLATARTMADTSRPVAMRAFIASGIYLMAISGAMVVNWLVVSFHGLTWV